MILTGSEFINTTIGQLVSAFIFRVSAVSPDPVPGDLVRLRGLVQAFPEIVILYRLPRGRLPAPFFPVWQPLRNTIPDIAGIRSQVYRARAFQAFQCFNGRHQLHTIVGSLRFTAGEFFFVVAVAQQGAPATGSGVAPAGAVSKNLHMAQATLSPAAHLVSHPVADSRGWFLQHRPPVPIGAGASVALWVSGWPPACAPPARRKLPATAIDHGADAATRFPLNAPRHTATVDAEKDNVFL